METNIPHIKSIIELQQSCVQQRTHRDEGKLNWQVFNDSGEQIFELNKAYNETQIFEIQDYAKKFELEAFNLGMQEMKRKKNNEIKTLEAKYNALIEQLRYENDKISSKLSELIGMSLEDDDNESSKIGIPEHMR